MVWRGEYQKVASPFLILQKQILISNTTQVQIQRIKLRTRVRRLVRKTRKLKLVMAQELINRHCAFDRNIEQDAQMFWVLES